MLEKVNTANIKDAVRFRSIQPDSSGSGICYVRDGIHKYTKADKPFITLFLQDIDGIVIPGYIFDVENFKAAGLELTKAIHSVVRINYTENYLPKYGMTVILDKVELLNSVSGEVLGAFVGSAKEASDKYPLLMDALTKELNTKITMPYTICTTSSMDYYQGEVGGICLHYWDMYNVLSAYGNIFKDAEERRQLFGVFVLYMFAHSNYIVARDKGEDNITLVVKLTAMINKYMQTLHLGEGAVEVVHTFFGYEPKDIYVRLVCQVSENLVRASKEISLFKALPDSREGNAGYGTIRRYQTKTD